VCVSTTTTSQFCPWVLFSQNHICETNKVKEREYLQIINPCWLLEFYFPCITTHYTHLQIHFARKVSLNNTFFDIHANGLAILLWYASASKQSQVLCVYVYKRNRKNKSADLYTHTYTRERDPCNLPNRPWNTEQTKQSWGKHSKINAPCRWLRMVKACLSLD